MVGSSPVSCGKVKGTSASCTDARVIRLGCSEGFHVWIFCSRRSRRSASRILGGLVFLSSIFILFLLLHEHWRGRSVEDVDRSLLLSGYISLSPLRLGSALFCLGKPVLGEKVSPGAFSGRRDVDTPLHNPLFPLLSLFFTPFHYLSPLPLPHLYSLAPFLALFVSSSFSRSNHSLAWEQNQVSFVTGLLFVFILLFSYWYIYKVLLFLLQPVFLSVFLPNMITGQVLAFRNVTAFTFTFFLMGQSI